MALHLVAQESAFAGLVALAVLRGTTETECGIQALEASCWREASDVLVAGYFGFDAVYDFLIPQHMLLILTMGQRKVQHFFPLSLLMVVAV